MTEKKKKNTTQRESINEKQLIEQIQQALAGKVSKDTVKKVLYAFKEEIKNTIPKKNIKLIGFMKVSLVERKARTVKKPNDKKEIFIAAKKVVVCKVGKALAKSAAIKES